MSKNKQIPYRKSRGCFADTPEGQAEYSAQWEDDPDTGPIREEAEVENS